MDDKVMFKALRGLQDYAIIQAAMQVDTEIRRVISHEDYQRLVEFSPTEDEKAAINSNPDVDFPLIFTETARQKLETNLLYIDPQKIKSPLKLHDWIYHWMPFQYLNLDEKGGQVDFLIARALGEASDYYSKRELQQLIDRLWRYRWIFDAYKCANWRIIALSDDEKELEDVIVDGKEAQRAFDELETRLNHIKDNVRTLDDWLEELYILTPLVKYALILHQYDESSAEDVKKRERFISEVSADIFSLFNFTMLMGVFFNNEKIWTQTHLPKLEAARGKLRSIKRYMSYRYRARVFYPKFWFEEALIYLMDEQTEPPLILDQFNHQHLTSIIISYDPAQAHRTFKSLSFSQE